jgi:hypothetical protein
MRFGTPDSEESGQPKRTDLTNGLHESAHDGRSRAKLQWGSQWLILDLLIYSYTVSDAGVVHQWMGNKLDMVKASVSEVECSDDKEDR